MTTDFQILKPLSLPIIWNIWTSLIVWFVQKQSRVNILNTYDKRPESYRLCFQNLTSLTYIFYHRICWGPCC